MNETSCSFCIGIVRTLAALILVACAGLFLSACARSSSTPAIIHVSLQPDQTPTVEISANQTLIVEIEGNPTTGYRWELNLRTRERRCFLFTELETKPNVGNTGQLNLAGAPSVQRWSIKIDSDFPCRKDQHISWTYRRSWEPLNTQDKTTQLILKPVSVSPSTLR